MKLLKTTITLLAIALLHTSCIIIEEDPSTEASISLEAKVSRYDLWQIDHHSTTGKWDVPFLATAFTISLYNGELYATDNAYSPDRYIGAYDTFDGTLTVNHYSDGFYDFEVSQTAPNELWLYNAHNNISYRLIGYNIK